MTDDKTEPIRVEKKIFTRLLKLSWQYRSGCIKAILLQILLLAFVIFGLSLIGVGIDYIQHLVDTKSKIPLWPFGFKPPEGWSTMKVLCVIAVANVAFAVARYFLTYRYSVTIVRLLQQGIVVELRAKIYEKMQRLSFGFFDLSKDSLCLNKFIFCNFIRCFIYCCL